MQRRMVAVFLLIVMALSVQGCADKNVKNTAQPVMIKTGKAIKKDMPMEIKATGHVEAYNMVNIVPRVTGKIIELKFASGDMVEKGQLLAIIDTQAFEAQLRETQANIDKIKAQEEYAQLEYSRKQPLLQSGAITSEELSQLKSQADFALANLAGARAQYDQAKINLEHCYIHSPLSGKAGDRLIDAGNIVTANSTVITSVNQLTPVYVVFNMPERYIAQIADAQKSGAVAVKACDDKGAVIATGKLVFVDNSVSKTVGTITLKAEYANDPVKLYPGQYVQAVATVGKIKNAIVIPSAALQPLNDGGVVFVVDATGKAHLHKVKIVQYSGNEVIITGDIKDGDTVVVDGQLNLTDGALTKNN